MNRTGSVCLFGLLSAATSFGQTFTTLASFTGTNGANPQSALTEVSPGVFLGTTSISSAQDAGTVFRVSAKGLTQLDTMNVGQQGNLPVGQLYPASNGYLYGINEGAGPSQGGTLFRVNYTGSLSVMATAVISPSPVIEATDGNLYFTSYNSSSQLTLVRASLTGTLTTLYTFPSGVAQAGPLVEASDGNLYGETQGSSPDYGTIFRLSLDGTVTTIYSFTGGSDGSQPLGGLTVGTGTGLLYGVTNAGGANGAGTIFSLSTNGTLTSLHSFTYDDGDNPLTGLSVASDHNLYGTNAGVGSFGPGTIFKIAPDGSNFQTVFTFPANTEAFPQVPGPGVIQGSDGLLYGTTLLGGATNQGEVFSLDLGLLAPAPKVVTFSPRNGSAGTSVLLTGRYFIGASQVTFNGVPAAYFSSQGGNYVVATVPAGATTGPITVTTPNGTVTSRFNFTVE